MEEEILKAVASWKSSKEWSYYASAADRANVRPENRLLDLATLIIHVGFFSIKSIFHVFRII